PAGREMLRGQAPRSRRRARRARTSSCVPTLLRSSPAPFVVSHACGGAVCSRHRAVRFVGMRPRRLARARTDRRSRTASARRTNDQRNPKCGRETVLGKRVLLGLVTAGVAAAVLLFGGILSGSHATSPLAGAIASARADAGRQAALVQLLAGLSSGDTAGYVRKLERRIAAHPGDADALVLVGLSYQQRARETGDPAFYQLSGEALRRASKAGGPLLLITQGRASLANTRHRFRDGLRLARQAIQLDPYSGAAYGALG